MDGKSSADRLGPGTGAASGAAARPVARPLGRALSPWSGALVLSAVGVYLAAHFLLRLAFGGALGFDDAEQALFAQSLEPGYRVLQPPLYTWLTLASFEVFGVGLWTAVLPRYLLLAVTFAALHAVARKWIPEPRSAALAVFAYALIYVFAYYAHHDLTHTTALGAGIALAFLAFARIVERPTSNLDYALLGVALAIGLLGKWNLVMLAVGLPLACLLYRPFRPLVLTPRVFIAIGTMALLVAPTGLWLLERSVSPSGIMAVTLEEAGPGGGGAIVAGTLALLGAAVLFPMPFLAVALPLFGRAMRRGAAAWRARTEARPRVTPSFLGLLIGIELVLHWLLVPVVGADVFTARWMHPALMILPIPVFQLVAAGAPDPRAVRAYLALVVIAVILVMGARTVRHVRGADHCGRCREMAPFAELAARLRGLGFEPGTIVADGYPIAGNLRLQFPSSRVLEPSSLRSVFPAEPGGGGCLAVWQTGSRNADAGAARIRRYLQTELRVPADAPMQRGEVSAPMHGSSTRMYALGYGYLAEGAGECR